MTENIKKIIEEKLTKITLPNKKKLIEEDIIEGISYKDGHIQISLFANKDNIEEIEVNHRKRISGKSKYGFSRVFNVLIDIIFIKLFHYSILI